MLSDFVHAARYPVGIGVDCVCISELKALDERTKGAFIKRTFTPEEIRLAQKSQDKWCFLAGRFAVKEAAFKALAPLTKEKFFDYRRVETLKNPDGSPYINLESLPDGVMAQSGADGLLVSVTGEGDFALAFVQAAKNNNSRQGQKSEIYCTYNLSYPEG